MGCRFAARDSSLGHGTHIDGFNDSEDEGSLVLPSGFSPGYKKYKWLLCSDEHNVPVAAAMGFTNSEVRTNVALLLARSNLSDLITLFSHHAIFS